MCIKDMVRIIGLKKEDMENAKLMVKKGDEKNGSSKRNTNNDGR